MKSSHLMHAFYMKFTLSIHHIIETGIEQRELSTGQ